MKKKTATKQTQQLSPENYIRQKSKYLPLGDCFVNADWEEAKMCQVAITRKHVNGNVTACMYLVDLSCLGVKDTLYQFNVPFYEVEEQLERFEANGVRFTGIPYELAHNIIYAGIEYAEEYGFKPCKEFSSITCHFLEDDDVVPLIEIECGGAGGNPLYVNSGFETPAREKAILAQLEKTAGKGNYHFILPGDKKNYYDEDESDDDDEDFYDDDEEEDEIETELLSLSKEEQKRLFINLLEQLGKSDDVHGEDVKRFSALTGILSCGMVDDGEIDEQLALLETKFGQLFVENEQLPNSLFSGTQNMDGETIIDLFYDSIGEIHSNKNPKKTIELIREKAGDVPIADFLELYYLKEKNGKKFKTGIEKSLQKHPDYFLIQLLQYEYPDKKKDNFREELEKIFSDNKQAITHFEAEYYFMLYTMYMIIDKNIELSTLLAFEEYVLDFDFLAEDSIKTIQSLTHLGIIAKVVERLEQTGELEQLKNK